MSEPCEVDRRTPLAAKDEPYRIRGTLEYGAIDLDPDQLFMR